MANKAVEEIRRYGIAGYYKRKLEAQMREADARRRRDVRCPECGGKIRRKRGYRVYGLVYHFYRCRFCGIEVADPYTSSLLSFSPGSQRP